MLTDFRDRLLKADEEISPVFSTERATQLAPHEGPMNILAGPQSGYPPPIGPNEKSFHFGQFEHHRRRPR
jgi:hypothetical protein